MFTPASASSFKSMIQNLPEIQTILSLQDYGYVNLCVRARTCFSLWKLKEHKKLMITGLHDTFHRMNKFYPSFLAWDGNICQKNGWSRIKTFPDVSAERTAAIFYSAWYGFRCFTSAKLARSTTAKKSGYRIS